MRQNRLLNDGWQFHLGEIEEPMKTVRKPQLSVAWQLRA